MSMIFSVYHFCSLLLKNYFYNLKIDDIEVQKHVGYSYRPYRDHLHSSGFKAVIVPPEMWKRSHNKLEYFSKVS